MFSTSHKVDYDPYQKIILKHWIDIKLFEMELGLVYFYNQLVVANPNSVVNTQLKTN